MNALVYDADDEDDGEEGDVEGDHKEDDDDDDDDEEEEEEEEEKEEEEDDEASPRRSHTLEMMLSWDSPFIFSASFSLSSPDPITDTTSVLTSI